jgi:hypothetical protein
MFALGEFGRILSGQKKRNQNTLNITSLIAANKHTDCHSDESADKVSSLNHVAKQLHPSARQKEIEEKRMEERNQKNPTATDLITIDDMKNKMSHLDETYDSEQIKELPNNVVVRVRVCGRDKQTQTTQLHSLTG